MAVYPFSLSLVVSLLLLWLTQVYAYFLEHFDLSSVYGPNQYRFLSVLISYMLQEECPCVGPQVEEQRKQKLTRYDCGYNFLSFEFVVETSSQKSETRIHCGLIICFC